MIYTVTLNPSLDIVYNTSCTEMKEYISADDTFKYPGGKPINVTRMLNNLGIPSLATGFLGGYPGEYLKDWFLEEKVENYFIDIEDETRVNVRVRTSKEEYTIAGEYPRVPKEKIDGLLVFLSRLREGDILVMGGSIPRDVDSEIYIRIAEICNANKAEFVIDTDHDSMKTLLPYKPLLIKPNLTNLANMFGVDEIKTEVDIIRYGRKCVELGAKNVIVSIGADGSYLFTEKGESYRSYGVEGEEVNSFNSRDAMIGGFIGVYMRLNDPIQSFRMAGAAASATAFVEDLADNELTKEIYEKTVIEKIELK